MSFWSYFGSPFPATTGFSAYRSPGLLVHLPVVLFSTLLGIWLCFGDLWLYPLFGLYLVVGLYFGRDLAIFAHYNPFITLGVIGGSIVFLVIAPELRISGPEPLICAAITGALGVMYALYISWYVDLDQDETRPPTTTRFPVIQRLIDRIDHAATQDGDSEPVRLRKTLLIFLSVAGMLLAPWVARHLSILSLPQAANAALSFAAISLVALLLLLITRRETVAAGLQLLALLMTPAVIHWQMGGFATSGGIVLWSLLAPLCALVFFGTRWATLWFGAFGLLVLGITARDVQLGLDMDTIVLFAENILLVSTLAFIALRFFIVERDRIQGALEHEQAHSEKLLLNILPAPIAARLKDDHQAP